MFLCAFYNVSNPIRTYFTLGKKGNDTIILSSESSTDEILAKCDQTLEPQRKKEKERAENRQRVWKFLEGIYKLYVI